MRCTICNDILSKHDKCIVPDEDTCANCFSEILENIEFIDSHIYNNRKIKSSD